MKKIIFLCLILTFIIVGVIILNVLQNVNSISEIDEKSAKASVDTSTWDTSKVTIVTDTSMGYEINVPIPNGYVMSSATGETEVKTGLVIYE